MARAKHPGTHDAAGRDTAAAKEALLIAELALAGARVAQEAAVEAQRAADTALTAATLARAAAASADRAARLLAEAAQMATAAEGDASDRFHEVRGKGLAEAG